jgi:hypothetical protein
MPDLTTAQLRTAIAKLPDVSLTVEGVYYRVSLTGNPADYVTDNASDALGSAYQMQLVASTMHRKVEAVA